jgi:Mg2+ and Co2+ transporter CorA
METLMITIFKTLPDGLTVVDHLVPGSWVHVVDPDRVETARLQEECGIPDTFITASLDVDALARIDREQDMLLITFLMPHVYSDDPSEVPYSTTPLGIILTTDCLFTISKIPPPFLSDLTKRYGRHLATAKRHRLVLLLFLAIAQSYVLYVTSKIKRTPSSGKCEFPYRTKSYWNCCATRRVWFISSPVWSLTTC